MTESNSPQRARFRSGRDERFTHRLESFSDIVLAFALGQMSLNLTFPAHVQTLYRDPTWLIAFLLTFTIIVGIWHAHHHIFDALFEPTPVQIVLNFAVLASSLMLAYMLQVYVHFGAATSAHAPAAAFGYFVAFGTTWTLLGAFGAVALRGRWAVLDARSRRQGSLNAARNAGIGLALLIGLAVTNALKVSFYAAVWSIPIVAVGVRIAIARVFPQRGSGEAAA